MEMKERKIWGRIQDIHHPSRRAAQFNNLKNALSLDSNRASEYHRMLVEEFKARGPRKSRVSFKVEKDHVTPINAGIDPDNWHADFIVREGLTFEQSPELLDYMHKRNIFDPLKDTLKDVGRHEIGHCEYPRGSGAGCPGDKVSYYDKMIDPIYDEIKRTGKFPDKFGEWLSSRLANSVSDIIDNYHVSQNLAKQRELFSGQTLFWYLQGQESGRYGAEYGLFVKLNLAVHGHKEDYELLKKFMPEGRKLGEKVSRLKKLFTPGNMSDKSTWELLSREYTREVLDLVDMEVPKHQTSADDQSPFTHPESPFSKKGGKNDPGSENGGGGQGPDSGKNGPGMGEERKEDPDEHFPPKGGSANCADECGEEGDKKGERAEGEGKKDPPESLPKKTPKSIKGIFRSKDSIQPFGQEEEEEDLTENEIEQIMGGRDPGKGLPFYIEPENALHAYYKSLARRVKLKADGDNPKAKFKLIPYMLRKFDPETDSSEDSFSGKVYLNPENKTWSPGVFKSKLEMDIPLNKEKKDLPEFMFSLIDTSGSMIGNWSYDTIAPWGDKSYYHYALITFYCLLRFFENERVLHKMKISAAIFSSETLDARGLRNVQDLLLKPATGGTQLDIQKIMDNLDGKKGVLFSMITDGDIFNWDEVRDEFMRIARKNQFFMIQIGNESRTSRDLRNEGFEVHTVHSQEEIIRLSIDLTVRKYQAEMNSRMKKELKKYERL